MSKNIKAIILAGGLGTRISEYTDLIPKPMVLIGKDPIITHIIKIFIKFKITHFCIALGYKKKIIENYFIKKSVSHRLSKGILICDLILMNKSVTIELIPTGKKTMTGGRVKRILKLYNDDFYLLTYGDGIANVNIDKLIKFHKKNLGLVSMTVVRPPSRFGHLELSNNLVKKFREKSQIDGVWINGGFMVVNKEFINYIDDDDTFLEKEPLEKLAKQKKLFAFKHNGFWQCMDTKRDKDFLDSIIKNKKIDLY